MKSIRHFSTESLPKNLRGPAWRAYMAHAMFDAATEPFTAQGMSGRHTSIEMTSFRLHALSLSGHSVNRMTTSLADVGRKGDVFCTIPVSGGFSYHTNSSVAAIGNREVLLCAPSEPSFAAYQDGTHLLVFELTGALPSEAIRRQWAQSLRQPRREKVSSKLLGEAEELYMLASDGKREERVVELAEGLSLSLTEELCPTENELYVNAVYRFIAEHASSPEIRISQVAEYVGFSTRHLARILEESGTSFTSMLRDQRISMAEQQLIYSHETVSNIGTACGFTTPASFARAFRQVTGLAPSVYRIQRRK